MDLNSSTDCLIKYSLMLLNLNTSQTDKTANQQTNQLMEDTTVIKATKKGIANLSRDVTWPTDSMGKLK